MHFLAGDIGGTNGHVALMRAAADGRPGGLETLAYRVYPCAAFPSLAALLQAFVVQHRMKLPGGTAYEPCYRVRAG